MARLFMLVYYDFCLLCCFFFFSSLFFRLPFPPDTARSLAFAARCFSSPTLSTVLPRLPLNLFFSFVCRVLFFAFARSLFICLNGKCCLALFCALGGLMNFGRASLCCWVCDSESVCMSRRGLESWEAMQNEFFSINLERPQWCCLVLFGSWIGLIRIHAQRFFSARQFEFQIKRTRFERLFSLFAQQ